MASRTRWTWVWVNSRSWWTGRPGVLRFMGSQRVGHDWETELNWKPSCGRGLFLESWRHMCCAGLGLVSHSCLSLCDPVDYSPPGSSVHGDSPGKNTGVGCHALLQGIFPNQGSNPKILHCRWILYHLSHLESPRIWEWVTYPFSRGSSWPRNQTGVSCIAGGFFTSWATKEVPWRHMRMPIIYTI